MCDTPAVWDVRFAGRIRAGEEPRQEKVKMRMNYMIRRRHLRVCYGYSSSIPLTLPARMSCVSNMYLLCRQYVPLVFPVCTSSVSSIVVGNTCDHVGS